MKKVLIFVCLYLSICLCSFAQNTTQRKLTLTAGYGLVTVPQMVEGLSDILGTAITGGTIRYDDATFSGALIAGIKFSTQNKWKYGVDVVYEKFTKKVYNNSSGQYLGDSEGKYWSIIPRVDYYWLNNPVFRLYSGIGAGASFASQKYENNSDSRVVFAFNVAPIGFELGNAIALFGETSFGYNGILNAGIRLRL
ncbi:hypothetical protein [Emticicia agri]|uniref:Outer membrane protein beta-barrel domain-containing protein n=1 Tax=Emticicia agri TaxID=2492393 RepID=A0A4Q5LVQ3_9BACT|nr:hypothetical protein [Emticicia agri]RYU93821.1 hypothetical protein EWM59_20075 [Emticicia agri]